MILELNYYIFVTIDMMAWVYIDGHLMIQNP